MRERERRNVRTIIENVRAGTLKWYNLPVASLVSGPKGSILAASAAAVSSLNFNSAASCFWLLFLSAKLYRLG